MPASSIHRPTLTTEQWKRVFTALDVGASAVELHSEPEIADAVAYFHATQLKDAPETKSFVNVADALIVNSKLAAGQRCGNYALIEPIARGGMGSVWRARREDGLYQSEVAVKLLGSLALSAQARTRFAREGELLARLSHPHIARLLDAGLTEDLQRFLVIELVPGIDIAAHCKKLSERERIVLFRQLLSAVSYAHSQLILHRDIKPGNVLVDANGQVKLLDFGVAKLFETTQNDADLAEPAADLTRAVGAAYTESYAAPEQIRGEVIGTQADVFALGTLLFELVLGERLTWNQPKRDWANRGALAVANNVTNKLHSDLLAVLTKAIANDAKERYETVAELDADLGRYLAAEPVHARVTGPWYRAMKFVQRHRLAVGGTALAVGAVVTSLAFAVHQLLELRVQQAETLKEAERANAVTQFVTGLFRASDRRIATKEDKGTLTAKEILDAGAARLLGNSLDEQPEVKISLLGTLAEIYGYIEDEQKFIALNEARISFARTRFGEKHSAVYDGKIIDIWSDIYPGMYPAARKSLIALETLMQGEPRRRSKTDERYAERLFAWAELERRAGEESLNKVIARFDQCISEYQAVSKGGEYFAVAIFNKGLAQKDSGRLAESLASMDTAITMLRDLPGTVTVDGGNIAQMYLGRAVLLGQMANHARASEDFDRAFKQFSETSGPNHALALNVRVARAEWLHGIGRRDEAWSEMHALAKIERLRTGNTFGIHEESFVRGKMLLAENRRSEAVLYLTKASDGWRKDKTNPVRLKSVNALLEKTLAQK
jgi:eukaryotic-like serine/threonine-protein kinase